MRRNVKRLVLGLVAVPVALYLLLALVFWVWGTVRLHFEVKRWEALGVPTRLADWRPADVPPETNAAPLYEQLRGRLEFTDEQEEALRDPWSIENPAEFIKPYEKMLSILHEAAQRPNCVWSAEQYQIRCNGPCDCTSITDLGCGYEFFEWHRLLVAEAVARWKSGEKLAGIASVRASNQIAEHAEATYLVFSWPVQNKLDTLAHMLAEADEFMDFLESTIPESDWVANQRTHIALDATHLLEMHRMGFKDGLCSVLEGSDPAESFEPFWHPMNWPLFKGLGDVITSNALSDSRWQWINAVEANSSHFPDYNDVITPWSSITAPIHDFFNFYRSNYPDYRRVRFIYVSLRVSALHEAIRIKEFKLANGEYPESWSMPVDPRTGEPVAYERLPNGGFAIHHPKDGYVDGWEWRFP